MSGSLRALLFTIAEDGLTLHTSSADSASTYRKGSCSVADTVKVDDIRKFDTVTTRCRCWRINLYQTHDSVPAEAQVIHVTVHAGDDKLSTQQPLAC